MQIKEEMTKLFEIIENNINGENLKWLVIIISFISLLSLWLLIKKKHSLKLDADKKRIAEEKLILELIEKEEKEKESFKRLCEESKIAEKRRIDKEKRKLKKEKEAKKKKEKQEPLTKSKIVKNKSPLKNKPQVKQSKRIVKDTSFKNDEKINSSVGSIFNGKKTTLKEVNNTNFESGSIKAYPIIQSSIQEGPKEIITLKSYEDPNKSFPKKIGYIPNIKFKQNEPYVYPVVKMPKKDRFIKFPRKGRSNKTGYTEGVFFNYLNKYFSNSLKVFNDRHITQKNSARPYEPDFILTNESEGKNIFINVEIDEPYDGFSKAPTHIIDGDIYRDNFFTNRGYIVIRFTEKQVFEESKNCCALIAKVIKSIDATFIINDELKLSNPTKQNQWDSLQSKKWAKEKYREKYLGINSFGVRPNIQYEYDQINSDLENEIEKKIQDVPIDNNKNESKDFLEKKYSHNRDNRISFDPIKHEYFIDGNPDTISVSQLIDRFFPEFDGLHIASRLKPTHEYYGLEPEIIVEKWKQNGMEQAQLGTVLHNEIENYYNNKSFDKENSEFQYFLKFKERYPKMIPYRTEWRIFDEELLIAGTVDMVYKKDNNELYMFDWKRSKKVIRSNGEPSLSDPYGNFTQFATGELSHLTNDSYYKYCLQQNIYKHILEKRYKVSISSMNLLILHPIYENYHWLKLPKMDNEVNYMLEMSKILR